MLGAAGLLLVVACGNVADLLLIRGLQRRREIAVRAALGAGRLRVLRQLAIEGLLLALLGLPVGLLVSAWGLWTMRPLILTCVPLVGSLRLDLDMLSFAAAVVTVTGIAFGLMPAIQAWRTNLSVVLQMALTFVLIVGAGLATRTFHNLLWIDPGFNRRSVLTMEIELPRDRYDYKRIDAFNDELLAEVRRLPGVVAGSTSDGLPLLDQGAHFFFQVEGDTTPPSDGYDSYSSWISTGYFRALGVPLLAGCDFEEADRDPKRRVLIVNRTLAERFWSVRNAIGKRLQRKGKEDSYEIIAVVEDECYQDEQLTGKLAVSPRTYFPRYSSGHANLSVRATADPLRLVPTIRAVIRTLDDQLIVKDTRLMEDVFWEVFRLQRLGMLLVGVFAVFAFALSITGLYGVVAHSTASRSGEMAVRMALGASPGDILRMVLMQGVKVALAGMAIGLGVIFVLARVTTSLLYGVTALDPPTLIGAALLLGLTCAGASLVPAFRAARIDPQTALRYE